MAEMKKNRGLIVVCTVAALQSLLWYAMDEPWAAVPGFLPAMYASVIVSGNPHGGDSYLFLCVFAFVFNAVLYWWIAFAAQPLLKKPWHQ